MTTTCYAVDVLAGTRYVTGDPDAATDWPTEHFTPAGLPPVGVMVSAWEATMTVEVDMTGSPMRLATVDPAFTADLPGSWSGAAGSVATISGIDYYEVDDWGYWLTDYLTFPSGADSADTVSLSSGSPHGGTAFDVQVRSRAADWDDCAAEGNSFMSTTALGPVSIDRTASGVLVRSRYNVNPSGQGDISGIASWASLGFTDNAWEWLRVTGDASNGIRWWTGGPGSWTVVHTQALPGNFDSFTSVTAWRVGNGQLASSARGVGFDGDISHVTLADSVAGPPWAELNLSDMSSALDTAWSSGGSEPDWSRGGNVGATGGVTGTETVRFDFTTPTRLDEFMAVFSSVSGSANIDQWCIEYVANRQRIGLGWMVA